jgi:type IX secretion system PorP/SprF family membrane protein
MRTHSLLLVLFFVHSVFLSHAQYFQFSQYNFTKQRINPATVALNDYASVSANYRHQTTAGEFNLNSNFLDASYPILSKKGVRWCGIGITFMDDRSGAGALFKTQEAAISYAMNVPLSKWQTLSVGVKTLYQTRALDMEGLYTESQYIPDRGFSESTFNGESDLTVKTNYFSLNLGMHWQKTDKAGNKVAYAGLSFFDFNKPQEDFITENQLNQTWVGAVGVRVYQKGNLGLLPEVLYTHGSSTSLFNFGLVTQYTLQGTNKIKDRIDIITKCVPGRSGIAGMQFHRENFSVGLSYDFPINKNNVGNQGALEVGIEIRKLVANSPRKPKTPVKKPPLPKPAQTPQPTTKKQPVQDSTKAPVEAIVKNEMSERLKHKQDSVDALASAGAIKHEALILETAVFHFNFEFNSSELDQESTQYLDNLAQALVDNPKLRIVLTGHTDNVGSDKFNLKLSEYRAQAIKDLLVTSGVAAERIQADGKGLREPLNSNRTPEERALNRRVQLKIIYED